jgi:hypothetical protein
MSRVLRKPQDNWSTIEKECYAIFVALLWEFDYFLLEGRHFFLLTDHRNLVYMAEPQPDWCENVVDKLMRRWKKLIIQQYNFGVMHIEGEKNVVADVFSRMIGRPRREYLKGVVDNAEACHLVFWCYDTFSHSSNKSAGRVHWACGIRRDPALVDNVPAEQVAFFEVGDKKSAG